MTTRSHSAPRRRSVLARAFACKLAPAISLGVLLLAGPHVFAQALPAAEATPVSTGFSLPAEAGTLTYGISASETLTWGYYGDSTASAFNLTGDLGYISSSSRDPFSIVLTGGRSWATGNEPSYEYMNLGLSQVFAFGRWSGVISDQADYLPGTAAGGLSGIAGVGDLGVSPIQTGTTPTGQGVLTDYSNRVDNTVSGSLSRALTGKTSANVGGSYSITRFVNNSSAANQGLSDDSVTGQAGLSHAFDARNTLGGSYAYSHFDYMGIAVSPVNPLSLSPPGFTTQTVSGSYTRIMSRQLSFTLQAGPQWTTLNSTSTQTSTTSLNASVSAVAVYNGRSTRGSIAYVRGANSGYGVIGGAFSNSVSASAARRFARVWSASAIASYTAATSLPVAGISPYQFNTVLAGGQLQRALGRSFSAYASYTLEHQSSSGSAYVVDVFNGYTQVLGFGVTYAPPSIRVGRK